MARRDAHQDGKKRVTLDVTHVTTWAELATAVWRGLCSPAKSAYHRKHALAGGALSDLLRGGWGLFTQEEAEAGQVELTVIGANRAREHMGWNKVERILQASPLVVVHKSATCPRRPPPPWRVSGRPGQNRRSKRKGKGR